MLVIEMLLASTLALSAAPAESELVFPLHPKHNHAPGIVECPNGDLIASWYRGSGERSADDVAVYGARRRKGSKEWSPPFLMQDTPGFPDGNTCLFIDRRGKLWLFWPVVIANSWESCLTRFLKTSDYESDGPPRWQDNGTIFLRPADFSKKMDEAAQREAKRREGKVGPAEMTYLVVVRQLAKTKLNQRLGWQTRCKPIQLPSGRILLPLYSDTFSAGLIAISDDEGATWFASEPLIGFGNIQPTLLRRNDGGIVAYMRENGPMRKIRVCESKDDGMSWGPVTESELPNPGAGVDGVRLHDGRWALVYNDTIKGRHQLAVSLSTDEGKTWKYTRHLEKHESGSYHYPAIIEGKDGSLHAIYTYSVKGGESMKHVRFSVEWIMEGDPPSSP